MGWLLTTAVLLTRLIPSPEPVPSRELDLPPAVVQALEPLNFDLIDIRNEQRLADQKSRKDGEPHTSFVIKRHVGASMGYDNTIVHGSVGLYLTVAEWGRWNFGVPSIGVGAGRYPIYDRATSRLDRKNQATLFISIASVHYRVGYLPSLGANWYINLEQVYDLRYNVAGSQFGVSFSTK